MIFNSLEFLFLFLPITYVVFWLLRTANSRFIWLTITGYVFYGWWDPRFCFLIGFSTLVSYLAGIGLLNSTTPSARRACLVVPIVIDLLLLGFFKYTNFILEISNSISEKLGMGSHGLRLDIILPVGISFYTFHTISYIVDCYQRKVVPTKNFFEFAAYVSLFSQLVAGPIVRFSQLEADLNRIASTDRATFIPRGVSLFLTGLIEKVVIADSIAFFIDPSIEKIHELDTLGAWQVLAAYAMQLYFDFSGYSTMSMGLGLLFGMHIPQNFNSPYKAVSLPDFWRRWHISLSTCMRDYLYIPLGGNRLGVPRTYVNLMLTMLIGGVWHGANMTFVAWGAWHGFWLCVFRSFSPENTWSKLFGRVVTILVVLLGWVWFRSPDMSTANIWFSRLFGLHSVNGQSQSAFLVGLTLISWFLALTCKNAVELHSEKTGFNYSPWAAAAIFGVVLALIVGWGNSPFLYFQF